MYNLLKNPLANGYLSLAKVEGLALHKICGNKGENGSVKTRILACFMQCWLRLLLESTLQSLFVN